MLTRSIIATHQGRLRCFLSMVLGQKTERFMNGAVLRLELSPNHISIQLVYDGELDESQPARKYYVMDLPQQKTTMFLPVVLTKTSIGTSNRPQHVRFEGSTIILKSRNTRDETIIDTKGAKFVFYLVRHGQGYHNRMDTATKLKKSVTWRDNQNTDRLMDAQLTHSGKLQALRAGQAMRKYKDFSGMQFMFCSDLFRTMQTLAILMSAFDQKIKQKEIVVLPCAHELNYISNGVCDGKQWFNAFENQSTCQKMGSKECTTKLYGFKIIWNFYKQFYGTHRSSRQRVQFCRTTNFIQNAINVCISEGISTETTAKQSSKKHSASKKRSPTKKRLATKKRSPTKKRLATKKRSPTKKRSATKKQPRAPT